MSDLASKLQQKIKTYKQQIEEALDVRPGQQAPAEDQDLQTADRGGPGCPTWPASSSRRSRPTNSRSRRPWMSDLASKLQQKIKTYKQQIEEAEDVRPGQQAP